MQGRTYVWINDASLSVDKTRFPKTVTEDLDSYLAAVDDFNKKALLLNQEIASLVRNEPSLRKLVLSTPGSGAGHVIFAGLLTKCRMSAFCP